jgi:hypothetical protein
MIAYRALRLFSYADGHVRTHGATKRTSDTVLGTGLVSREIALGADLGRNFQNVLRADTYAQTASFAQDFIDVVTIRHFLTTPSGRRIYLCFDLLGHLAPFIQKRACSHHP